MYEHRGANPFRRVVRVTAGWPPVSWIYSRTLHHIDRLVFRFTRVTQDVVARELEGEERARHYERGIQIYPGWTAYRKRAAHRRIPVLELTPVR